MPSGGPCKFDRALNLDWLCVTGFVTGRIFSLEMNFIESKVEDNSSKYIFFFKVV